MNDKLVELLILEHFQFSDQKLRTEKKKIDVMPSTSADALATTTSDDKKIRLNEDEVFSRSL